MASITVRNLTSREVYISDLYDSLDPYEVVTLQRSMGQLSGMTSLHQAVRDAIISVDIYMDAVERRLSGLDSGGGSTTASNVGTGTGAWFKMKVGDDLQFKTVLAGPNISITNNDDEVTIGVVGAGSSAGSWIVIEDIVAQDGSPSVGEKVFQDAPQNSVLVSCTAYTSAIRVRVRSSHPVVVVDGNTRVLTLDASGGYYEGTADLTLVAAGDVVASVTPPDGGSGAATRVAVAMDTAPVITDVRFIGGYPGAQTELKAGDTFQITGTTDKPCVGVEVIDTGAGTGQVFSFASTTTFTVTIFIANRGNVSQLFPAFVRARNAAGSYGANRSTNLSGASVDGTNVVRLNNLHPTISFGAITYPASQGALKGGESATVSVSITNADTAGFTSPNGELSITAPTVLAATKTVSRLSGNYNVSTNNLRGDVVRAANAASATAQTVVNIANVAATITVNAPAARLRSGGNDGTVPQDHTISIVSSQNLYSAPTLEAGAGGGTLQGAAWAGGPTTFTRALRVHDNDAKGNYNWTGLVATNLAGIVTNTIVSGAAYVLGGFVQRSLVFAPFLQTTTLHVVVTSYSKLQAGIFTATNQPALRTGVQGDHSNYLNQFTVDAIGASPVTLFWNDQAAASSNSGGTAQITNVEEVV